MYSVHVQETAKRRAKFGWPPVNDVAAVTKPSQAKTRNALKFAGMHQTKKRISGANEQMFILLCGHIEEILLFIKFFPIVDTCLSCE